MSSTSIYTPIKPTYLYIKQHSVTGLKYFGKTTRNPNKYYGSGKYWLKHIKKHGKEFVKTIWVSDLYTDTSIVEIALHFSYENNIVESDNWANLTIENGLDGGSMFLNKTHSEETKLKLSSIMKGKNKGNIPWNKGICYNKKENNKSKPCSEETKLKLSLVMKNKTPWNKGKPCSEETKLKLSLVNKNKQQIVITCPNCNKSGGESNMKRYHFDKCKF